jgi:hypothetical protein
MPTLSMSAEELAAIKRMVEERHYEIQHWVSLCEQPPIRESGLERAKEALGVCLIAVQALQRIIE